MTQNESILTQILKLTPEKHRTGSCVFDLDSTLFCVSTRTEKILKDFAARTDLESPSLKKLQTQLRDVHMTPSDWGLRSAFERHGVTVNFEDFEVLRRYWVERFFSNDYLKYDALYEQSNDFAQHCANLGYRVLYLTGRDDAGMLAGSVWQLRHWNFPLEQESDLIMRPKSFEKDEDFKVHVLKDLRSQFEPVYFFENEPVIINRVRRSGLDVEVIHMDSTHSGREEVEGHIHRISPSTYMEFLKSLKEDRP